MELSKKYMSISPSVTLSITAKAKRLKNKGIDVVSFGAGEPDFNTPLYIQEAAIYAIRNGFTKYTPASGMDELKEAICEKLKRDNDCLYKPSQIVVSNGAKHSLFNALSAICNPGDEVIIPSPYWLSYPELVKMADGIPVFINTKEDNDFKIDIEELEKSITHKTKALILNNPNNPTGTVYTREELLKIAEIVIKNDIILISDEIYEKLIYNGEHVCIASLMDDIKKRTILVNGMSKAYSMTGWRIGYTACDETIATIMSSLQSHSSSNPNSIAQYASTVALNGPQDDVYIMRGEFEKRRDYMVEKINSIKGLSSNKPLGAFYVMVNIKEMKNKKIKEFEIKSSFDFCNALLETENVAAIPGSAFGNDDYVRLSYATSMGNIEKGLERIEEFLR